MPYLSDMINDHKATMKLRNNKNQSGEWKIQLCMHVNFIFSKDTGETRIIYIWSDNVEIMMSDKTNDIIEELLRSFLNSYQKEEQILRGESDFIFESVDLLDYHSHKKSLKRNKSYIKSPKWLENKRAATNPQNNDDNCSQYAITAVLNYNRIKKKTPGKNIKH